MVYESLSVGSPEYVCWVPEHEVPCHKVFPEAAEQTMPPETFPMRSHDAGTRIEESSAFSDVTTILPAAGTGFTTTEADAVALPPGPVQEILYVAVPTDPGVSGTSPLVGCGPDQSPEPVHAVALVVLIVRVIGCPRVMLAGDALRVTAGIAFTVICAVSQTLV
jgi:hypothetical protein